MKKGILKNNKISSFIKILSLLPGFKVLKITQPIIVVYIGLLVNNLQSKLLKNKPIIDF